MAPIAIDCAWRPVTDDVSAPLKLIELSYSPAGRASYVFEAMRRPISK
jgi:hypothetical protein